MSIQEAPRARSGILVVEDEPLLLLVVSETLRDAGHTVWDVGNGAAGLALIRTNPEIALLITDIKMPDMNGYQLVKSALALRPDLKVILITGYAQDPIPKEFLEGGARVLYKPFDFDKLPGFANEVLSGG